MIATSHTASMYVARHPPSQAGRPGGLGVESKVVEARICILAAAIALAAANLAPAQLAYDPASSLGTGTSPRCVRAGDLDADGDRDLVVAHEGSNDVRIFTNDGN